jgi:hypothetical protein
MTMHSPQCYSGHTVTHVQPQIHSVLTLVESAHNSTAAIAVPTAQPLAQPAPRQQQQQQQHAPQQPTVHATYTHPMTVSANVLPKSHSYAVAAPQYQPVQQPYQYHVCFNQKYNAMPIYHYNAMPTTGIALLDDSTPYEHVRSRVRHACSNCKAAKTKCDSDRPCKRCTRTGQSHTCADSVHKKRGRKRGSAVEECYHGESADNDDDERDSDDAADDRTDDGHAEETTTLTSDHVPVLHDSGWVLVMHDLGRLRLLLGRGIERDYPSGVIVLDE